MPTQHGPLCGDSPGEDQLPSDTEVGGFRIKRLLGEGAMGQVYLAQDLKLGRRVALKIGKRGASGRDDLQRLLGEARATASLSHPHIVTIHAIGEHEGRPFLALEYIDGESLRARLESGPVPEREALRIMRAVAEGVADAHGHNLVHADLKPENIVIPRDGRVRIVDFGLARLFGTDAGSASGTPAYMAPERWIGAAPTGAMDVWALGVLICELIIGSRPYAATDVAKSCYGGAPLAPPALPDAAWAQVTRDCLAQDPEKRPSAADVARRLGVLLRDWPRSPERTRRATPAGRRSSTRSSRSSAPARWFRSRGLRESARARSSRPRWCPGSRTAAPGR